ncbi:hypothetical protein [Aliamphritea spongicola]|uniref:hypothetical protein n=1 Tax=Aliamphritea spongicola TaxID=707589 RepID=UPI00196A9EC8|nr:hypothetical protein [Aliamphritea spongicola]MBN3560543.1 hypothetical protein [Aliamphritea spongicola]
MDQLTVPTIPEIHPSTNQVSQLAVMFSELSAEVFCLNKQGAQIDLEFLGGQGVRLLICGPLSNYTQLATFAVFAAIKRTSARIHHRQMASYLFFEDIISGKATFEETDKQLQQWNRQLNIVRQNLKLFTSYQPSPQMQVTER